MSDLAKIELMNLNVSSVRALSLMRYNVDHYNVLT